MSEKDVSVMQNHTYEDNQIYYVNSFAEYIDNLQSAPWICENWANCRDSYMSLCGREQKMSVLNDFLNRDEDILWMSVTGNHAEDMLQQFCAQVNDRTDWKVVWLSTDSSKQLSKFRSWEYPKKLLVVAKKDGGMEEHLSNWLCNLYDTDPSLHPKTLRIILMEQEPLDKIPPTCDPIWPQITPAWYQMFTSSRERRRAVERYCADHDHPCLSLSANHKKIIDTPMDDTIDCYREIC